MIAFETWLPQILDYCEFITNDRDIQQAWINHDTSDTSVTDFDELYEQIFDDLDSDFFQPKLSIYLPTNAEACTAITNFLETLKQVDQDRMTYTELQDARMLLGSAQWQALRNSAHAAISTPFFQKFQD